MEKTVVTVTGVKADPKDCRKIKGEYYLLGDNSIENSGDCYYLNNKYYKSNTGYILFDHSSKQYVLKSKMKDKLLVENGLVGFDEENNPIFGKFYLDTAEDTIQVHIKGYKYVALNEKILEDNRDYLEDLATGVYYQRQQLDAHRFVFPTPCDKKYKYTLPYDSRGLTKSAEVLYQRLYNREPSDLIKSLGIDLTHDLTFGLEFETTQGTIPNRVQNKLGLLPLRDGSIEGLEFVTIPLAGNKGLQTVLDILTELNKRTVYDNDCALHIHIGNIPRTESFFLALSRVLYAVQDDMYKLFPYHKKENCGIKRKCYTKPLPEKETLLLYKKDIKTATDILESFKILYKFLSNGQDYSQMKYKLENVKSHPSDPGGNSKWNIKSRYHWVNLIPLLFGNKQTVEFRIHTPTYDKNKIINFMFLCFAIVKYAKDNEVSILSDFDKHINLTLTDVLFSCYHGKGGAVNDIFLDEMYRYFDNRRQHFTRRTSQGDFVAPEDEFSFRARYIDWNKENAFDYKSTQKKPSYIKFQSNAIRDIENELEIERFRAGRPVAVAGRRRERGEIERHPHPADEFVNRMLNAEMEVPPEDINPHIDFANIHVADMRNIEFGIPLPDEVAQQHDEDEDFNLWMDEEDGEFEEREEQDELPI